MTDEVSGISETNREDNFQVLHKPQDGNSFKGIKCTKTSVITLDQLENCKRLSDFSNQKFQALAKISSKPLENSSNVNNNSSPMPDITNDTSGVNNSADEFLMQVDGEKKFMLVIKRLDKVDNERPSTDESTMASPEHEEISVDKPEEFVENVSIPFKPIKVLNGEGGSIKVQVQGFQINEDKLNQSEDQALSSEFTYTCCLCLENMDSLSIVSHCSFHFPLKSIDSCKICSFRSDSILDFKNHLSKHMIHLIGFQSMEKDGNDLYESKKHETSTDVQCLRTSSENNNNGRIPFYQCDKCSKIFLEKKSFTLHSLRNNCVDHSLKFPETSHDKVKITVCGFQYNNDNSCEKDYDINYRGTTHFKLDYTCCICLEKVESQDVILHSRNHYPLKLTDSCKICSFTCESVDYLEKHLENHKIHLDGLNVSSHKSLGKDSVNISPNIFQSFARKDITKQVNVKTKTGLRCKVCKKIFENLNAFRLHLKNGDCITLRAFSCDKCDKKYTTMKLLRSHIALQHENQQKQSLYCLCHICGTRVKVVGIKRHIKENHEKVKKPRLVSNDRGEKKVKRCTDKIICDICGVNVHRYRFKKHYSMHSSERKFVCTVCEKSFTNDISYKSHLKIHSLVRPYACDICSIAFKRRDHVRVHQARVHKVNVERNYQCDICYRRFITNTRLQLHIRTHLEPNSYECVECKVIFSTETGLKCHQSLTNHEGIEQHASCSVTQSTKVNKYVCKICDQRYGSKTSLRKHEIIHKEKTEDSFAAGLTGEEVFECPECNIKYASDFSLKLHMIRTKHASYEDDWERNKKSEIEKLTGVKLKCFSCDKCNARFNTKHALKLHRLKSEHFINCTLCNDFTVVDLDEHKKEKCHGLFNLCSATHQCSVCLKTFQTDKILQRHIMLKHSTIVYTDTSQSILRNPFETTTVDKIVVINTQN